MMDSDLGEDLTFQLSRSVNWLRDHPFRKAGPPLRKWVHLKTHERKGRNNYPFDEIMYFPFPEFLCVCSLYRDTIRLLVLLAYEFWLRKT